MSKYSYTVSGRDGNNEAWNVQGQIKSDKPGAFPEVVLQAQREAFQQLTQGKAVYGSPGVGCKGPYRITYLEVRELQS